MKPRSQSKPHISRPSTRAQLTARKGRCHYGRKDHNMWFSIKTSFQKTLIVSSTWFTIPEGLGAKPGRRPQGFSCCRDLPCTFQGIDRNASFLTVCATSWLGRHWGPSSEVRATENNLPFLKQSRSTRLAEECRGPFNSTTGSPVHPHWAYH